MTWGIIGVIIWLIFGSKGIQWMDQAISDNSNPFKSDSESTVG